MKTAFVFPGQGSQEPGMADPFGTAWPEVRERLQELDSHVDAALLEQLETGDRETLRRTRNAQITVFAVGVAVAEAVVDRTGIEPDVVAGHSLGHYTAAAHAGLFSPTAGIDLVAERGAAMERAGRTRGPGKMAAVLFAAPDLVRTVCDAVEGASVAAFNTDRQTVVSGTEAAVDEVRSRIEDRERARFRELDVGAAFHSPVMEPAVEPIATALGATQMDGADTTIVSDVSATPYVEPEAGRRELIDQVRSPVDWVGAVRRLREADVERFVELPPAGTLAEFVSRLAPDADVVAIDDPDDLAALATEASHE